jgi:pimeloyl-ACP methyl ester carboxylesterase
MARACKIVCGALAGLIALLVAATGIGDLVIGWENPPIGRMVDSTAGRQHVLDVGPDASGLAAPAIVLLHGATANLADMRLALVGRLRANHRVVAVDRPGSGWSERTGGAADAPPQRQAAVLHEVLGKIGVKRPVLVAHSWAGAVGLAYALEYPDALSGLVLLAPLARHWQSDLRPYAVLADRPWLGAVFAHTLAVPLGLLLTDRMVARAFAPQMPPADYVANASILLAARPATFIANAQDLMSLDSFSATLDSRLARMAVPTVIMTGTDDHLVPPRTQARAIARDLPHARLIVFPGSGHMLHYVQRDRVISEIEGLIKAADDAPRAATGRR